MKILPVILCHEPSAPENLKQRVRVKSLDEEIGAGERCGRFWGWLKLSRELLAEHLKDAER
jgi:hypothetical protein